jgi:hypothetical protein
MLRTLAIRVTSQIATRFRLWRQEVSYPVILQSVIELMLKVFVDGNFEDGYIASSGVWDRSCQVHFSFKAQGAHPGSYWSYVLELRMKYIAQCWSLQFAGCVRANARVESNCRLQHWAIFFPRVQLSLTKVLLPSDGLINFFRKRLSNWLFRRHPRYWSIPIQTDGI